MEIKQLNSESWIKKPPPLFNNSVSLAQIMQTPCIMIFSWVQRFYITELLKGLLGYIEKEVFQIIW